ncbi:DUF2187 domain-containing protein [Bacillus thuringiensis serovar yunnanensis]|nr:DUF2187 domain-containing protein [Bacillus thuringiensis serovar yunnanensis]
MDKIKSTSTINIGDNVKFPYRKDNALQLSGRVVKVLENTIIVDITELLQINGKINEIEDRQLVKNGIYQRVNKGEKNL